jgi:hypothetical protein
MTGKAFDVSRLKKAAEPDEPRLTFSDAATEIAHALKIEDEAAAMMLYGLCATGNVRWVDRQGAVMDEDKVTVADFNDKPAYVLAADVRYYLAEWSDDPLPRRREEVIRKLLVEGLVPPRKISWKSFYKRVRDDCNGWLGPGMPGLGFSDKQIQRLVNELRAK